MYPSSFEYHRASSVADALAMLEQYGDDAKVLAGGHSLLPIMKLRFATPSHLIDIGRIAALDGITESAGTVTIGAMTRHADVASSAGIAKSLRAVSEAAAAIGDAQVRNRGTIGGSLAHADPGADLPAVMVAMGAQIVATGKSGDRTIAAESFFTDTFATSLRKGELITQIRIPVPAAGSGSAYVKYADAASGYAVVGVAALVTVAGGTVKAARVAMTGASSRAMRLAAVEAALIGKPANATSAAAAAQSTSAGLDLYDDARGSAAYKANLAAVYVARAVNTALSRA
ncbi:MAG: FAD binding domain-containing protein [Deltaproteobacteria bacterium]|nr:xanthine dehydrogenase family protein subunit M [Acidimicrobiia bacterium]